LNLIASMHVDGVRFPGNLSPAPPPGAPAAGILLLLLLPAIFSGCDSRRARTAPSPVPASPAETPPEPAFPLDGHADQRLIAGLEFAEVFDMGDQIFDARFNEVDGVGALLLPDGVTPLPARFSPVPPGGGRFTGPNAPSCVNCHNSPFPTSAGANSANVLQDPARAGEPPFNRRNTTSLFGAGVLQRLAEEITEDLLAVRETAAASALAGGPPVTLALRSKGISYGSITAQRDADGALSLDLSGIEGIDPDLVIRPYGWKGNVPSLRGFCRGAARNELGMEPEELVARDPGGRRDPDGDGVTRELSVGDITAITIYVAAQEVPQTLERLVLGKVLPPPPSSVAILIARGRALFSEIGCAGCHLPELRLLNPVFEEPTLRGGGAYHDPLMDPLATGLDPDRPFRFNLVRQGDPPRLELHPRGGARVQLYGDLKRHNLGRQLADAQETPVEGADGSQREIGGRKLVVGRSEFLTAELWGVGNTGPWLHDGRAGTLKAAIVLHGVDAPPPPGDPARSEAQESRDAFVALADQDQSAVVEFLRSLVLFTLEEAE
jgi:hypothetical protein